MRTNYRTLPALVDFMNGVFDDSFWHWNRLVDGRWHAAAEETILGRQRFTKSGLRMDGVINEMAQLP